MNSDLSFNMTEEKEDTNHLLYFKYKLIQAHRECAKRDNVSKQVLIQCFFNNGYDLKAAIVAAMNSMGGVHAPIKSCYVFLKRLIEGENIQAMMKRHPIVPGFGCSFVKGARDPLLDHLHSYVHRQLPEFEMLETSIRNIIGKPIFPNIAFYTAVYAHASNTEFIFSEHILLEARIPAWIEILKQEFNDESERTD